MMLKEVGLFVLKSVQLPNNTFNSFFYLNQLDIPSRGISRAVDIVALHLRYGNDLEKSYFTSMGPNVAQVPRSHVGASPVIIQRLGLVEGDEIFISLCHAQSVSAVAVRPKSDDDYNIICKLQNIMENVILNQIRIVAPQQPITLKIGNIIVDLIVENIKPVGEYGLLEQFTEIVVLDIFSEPLDSGLGIKSLNSSTSLTDLAYKFFQWVIPFWSSNEDKCTDTNASFSPKYVVTSACEKKQKQVLEYRVVRDLELKSATDCVVTNYGFKTDVGTACKISKLPEKTILFPTSAELSRQLEQHQIHCMIKSQQSSVPESDLKIYLNRRLMKNLNVTVGSRVIIEDITSLPQDSITNEASYEILEEEAPCYLWGSVKGILETILCTVTRSVEFGHYNNILIIGPAGCGKSNVLSEIGKGCAMKNLFCSIVYCKDLRGKKLESLLKLLTGKWSECAYREPSVLLLDDLDALMYLNEDEELESGESAMYCKRIATLLADLFENFAQNSNITVVATSISVASLGPTLASNRGPRLFELVLTIPELTKEERLAILTHFSAEISPELLARTHGYRIQDLVDLVARARLQAAVANRKELMEDDIVVALESTTPLALQGMQLHVDIPYAWCDVGGMDEVKTKLDEIFRWPSQYPEIFASCPLTLQAGALLYGPPGCGKTFIAGALANECGMNFKSVKGPELLSKFVGASEAAVRNLFESARQAHPCLLFFDELDSLAPRRGADSTGVTDRVVNQLLTELDGVEGRTGVWVLGASSRPDLIDPALLRPGRLDRAIHCPVPEFDERLRILHVLSRSLKLADDVNLAFIAEKTDSFTGADLRALFFNCQMKVIQEFPEDKGESELIVTSAHVSAALDETKSSLSKSEQLKYKNIYARFQAAKNAKKTQYVMDKPQRVTFA